MDAARNLTSKLCLFFFLFFLFLIFYLKEASSAHSLFLIRSASAQIPPPSVPCDSTESPEFHSLRPYQASPCLPDVSDEALFCGNDLVLKDTIKVNKSQATSCDDSGDKITCYFSVGRNAQVAIDLSGAELPIMGNTQLVANSQNQDESLDDADKVNDYVSWYLSGASKKAESETQNLTEEEAGEKIKEFAGPLQKLLPLSTQNDIRSETVKAAGESRHDQVVGCVNLANGITSCYPQRFGVREVRLSEWKNNLPPKESDYPNYHDFWIAYREWRGDWCLSIFGGNLCIDNIFTARYPGNLFSYIPLSSTEDRKGEVESETVSVQRSGDVLVTDLTFSNQEPAELFFSHMEENNGLAEILQSTFAPKGSEKTGGGTTSATTPQACDLAQIRTNPGDDLFAGEIAGDLSYTADFSCEFVKPEGVGNACSQEEECPQGTNCNANGRCVANPNPSCSKDIFVNLSLITKTPLVDELYSRLVDGTTSVFKRIFPKIGTDGALTALLDIPGATGVEYKSVSGPQLVYAGNPGNERKGESAELYFPHVGSISEYFLKGIQTILRPKGFGESILSGQKKTLPKEPKPKDEEGSGEVDCNQNAPEVNVAGLISKSAFAALADRWAGNDNFAEECFNDVVAKAKSRGVNPAYALITWLVESGASNYGTSVEDFGVHLGDVRGFAAQIDRFIGTVTGGAHNYCATHGNPSWPSKLYGHIACYVSGEYDQSRPDYVRLKDRIKGYYDTFTGSLWPAISGGCGLPSGPTDNSCP